MLGKGDPGIYELGKSEATSKVKGSPSFDEDYEVDASTTVPNTGAAFRL